MSDIVPITEDWSSPEKVQENCVALLKELLEAAEAGQMKAFTYAYLTPGDVVATGWVRGNVFSVTLAGLVAALKHKILSEWLG